MNIEIDLSGVTGVSGAPNPFAALVFIVTHGGWVILIPVFFWGIFQLWVNWRKNLFHAKQKFVILAIDVPRENEQSPKSVEQIFAHLSGIQKGGNLKERLIDGYTQPSISLEIVSIEGYVQFLVHAPEQFRDLVEAAFYAQYPNAEITEVEDYTKPFKTLFPNEEFDIWGTELTLTNKEFLPIRTYPAFEHTLSQTFFDPLANILEVFSRLGRGEQFWLQIVITPPRNDEWREEGLHLIQKLIGAKTKSKRNDLLWLPVNVAQGLYESAVASVVEPTGFGESGGEADNGPPNQMQYLPPNERAVVEQVGIKVSKMAYESKMRFIYLAKHDMFDKSRVAGPIGAIRQYNTLDMNGFKVDKKTKTAVDYFFVKTRTRWRKRRILWNYKHRSFHAGRNEYILNIEELASLYHFPVTTVVKAPRIQKTASKRGEPPVTLPVESEFSRTRPFRPGETHEAEEAPIQPPAELPPVSAPPPIQPLPPPTVGATPPDNLPV